MACRKLQSLKEHHHMGHISLSAMKKLEVSPRFELRSLNLSLFKCSNLTIFACTYYLFYNFSDHTIIRLHLGQFCCSVICQTLAGLALPAFSPSESLTVSETPTIVLLYFLLR